MILSEYKETVIKAAYANDIVVIESLLTDSALSQDVKLKLFNFTLMLAASYSYPDVAQAVFACSDLTCEMMKSMSLGAALIKAARYGHLEVIQVIFRALEFSGLEEAELKKIIIYENINGETAYITAACHNQAEVIRELHRQISQLHLLSLGYDFLIHCDQNHKTALMYAMESPTGENTQNAILELWNDSFELNLLIDNKNRSERLLYSLGSEAKFKTEAILMSAIENNKIERVQFLLVQVAKESPEKKSKILNSAFILAARRGYAEIVEIILSFVDSKPEVIASFLNEVDEAVGPEDTALIQAARNGHVKVVDIILRALKNELVPITNSLNRANAQGETAFIAAARNHHANIIEVLFNYTHSDFLFCQMLRHQDQEHNTGLTYAAYQIQEDSITIIASIFQSLQKRVCEAIENSNERILKELLDSLGKARFWFLKTIRFEKTYTLLMVAIKSNNLIVIKEVLSGLELSQQFMLLDQENDEGDTALIIAQKMKYYSIAHWLSFYVRSRLMEGSASRALVALTSNYLELPKINKAILDEWVNGLPGDPKEGSRHKAMFNIMKNANTNACFSELIKNYTVEILSWSNCLMNSSSPIEQEFSCYLREIFSDRKYVNLMKIVVLIWISIHDRDQYNSQIDFKIQLEERQEAWIKSWYSFHQALKSEHIKADYNHCENATINVLASSLCGLHSCVNALIVNTDILEVSAKYLLVSQFNCADYTIDQLVKLRESLTNYNHQLTFDVKQILKPKLKTALHAKFDKFISDRFIKEEDIDSVIDRTLILYSFHSEKIHQEIQKKLVAGIEERSPVVPISRKRLR